MARGQYVLVYLEQLLGNAVRAHICGPGTGSGVSYWLPNGTDAAPLVESLNTCYTYALDLKQHYEPRHRRVRRPKTRVE